jgi:hypothetical protein
MNQRDILEKRPKNVCIQGFGGFGGHRGKTLVLGILEIL